MKVGSEVMFNRPGAGWDVFDFGTVTAVDGDLVTVQLRNGCRMTVRRDCLTTWDAMLDAALGAEKEDDGG